LRRAYEPISIQKQHPWNGEYGPDPSAILKFDRLMFRKASFMRRRLISDFLVHRRSGASTSCNGSHCSTARFEVSVVPASCT
jgi:hypothetical protein